MIQIQALQIMQLLKRPKLLKMETHRSDVRDHRKVGRFWMSPVAGLLLTPRLENQGSQKSGGRWWGRQRPEQCPVCIFSLDIPHDHCRISRREAWSKISNSLVASLRSHHSHCLMRLYGLNLQERNKTSPLAGDKHPCAVLELRFCWLLRHLREGCDSYYEKN